MSVGLSVCLSVCLSVGLSVGLSVTTCVQKCANVVFLERKYGQNGFFQPRCLSVKMLLLKNKLTFWITLDVLDKNICSFYTKVYKQSRNYEMKFQLFSL